MSTEFAAWLRRHHDHFLTYEAWQVAQIALACGFSMAEIAPDVTKWVTASRRRLAFWDNPLALQWLELSSYQRRGEEWDSK